MYSHDDIMELIPDYALGKVSAEDHEAITAHLRDCAECRAWLEDCRQINDGLGAVAAEHPEPMQMALYLRFPGDLETPERERIALHLELCDECALRSRAIQEMEQKGVLEDVTVATTPRRGSRSFLSAVFERPILVATLAFAGLLLIAVPVMRLVQTGEMVVLVDDLEAVTQATIQLTEQTRSSLRAPSISASENEGHVFLEVRFNPVQGMSYRVVIENDDGESVLDKPLAAGSAARGVAIIRLDPGELPPDKYVASIVPVGDGSGVRFDYPFTLQP